MANPPEIQAALEWGMRQAAMRLNRIEADQKTVAERKWQAGLKPAKPQQPCDHGLFSDEMDQVEMFMDPTNE